MAKESADFQTGQGAGKPARQFRRMTLEEYVNLPESTMPLDANWFGARL